MNPDALHALIEARDPAALEPLGAAPLGIDSRQRSAFDVALAAGFDPAIALLAVRKDAHALAAQPDEALRMPIKQTVAQADAFRALDKTEAGLRNTFGSDLPFGRTPLLQACRQGRLDVVDQLLAHGAKPGKKDLLGLDETDLCLATGGIAALEAFVQACARHARKPTLGEPAAMTLLHHPEALAGLQRNMSLSAGALRQLLACHCARLDTEAVKALLDGGLDPDKAVHEHANPVYEACTSRMLWLEELPDWLPLAWAFARHAGPPGSQAASFDPHAALTLAEQTRLAREALRAKQARIDACTPGADALAEQNARRLAVIDLLLAAGIDRALVRKKAPAFFVRDLLLQEQPALLAGLLERGFDLTPAAHERDMIDARHLATLDILLAGKPAAAQPPGFLSITDGDARWELPGEASLFALALPPAAGNAGQALVRISLHDSYGPIPGCAIALRDAGAGDDAWQAMALREELIEDPEAGGMRLRAPGEPAPLAEAPWSATFEHPWPLASGRSRVEIRVQSSIDALNLVIDDWTPGA